MKMRKMMYQLASIGRPGDEEVHVASLLLLVMTKGAKVMGSYYYSRCVGTNTYDVMETT